MLSRFELLTDYEGAILYVLDYIEKSKHIFSCAYDVVDQRGRNEKKRRRRRNFLRTQRTNIHIG